MKLSAKFDDFDYWTKLEAFKERGCALIIQDLLKDIGPKTTIFLNTGIKISQNDHFLKCVLHIRNNSKCIKFSNEIAAKKNIINYLLFSV